MGETVEMRSRSERASPKKKQLAEGHELPLASMIKNGATIRISIAGRVPTVNGVVRSFDKFTITILSDGDEYPTTYFKHAIESFTRVR